MSHTLTVKTEIRSLDALIRACKTLGLEPPILMSKTEARLSDAQVESGHAVKLPGWYKHILVDLETGTVHQDNYNGHWGKIEELDKFTQRCSVEAAKTEIEAQGYYCEETVNEKGEIVLDFDVD